MTDVEGLSVTALPSSTYRLQLTPHFTLDDAAVVVDYLGHLGVGWVYLSPILRAEPGSQHGYDVIDHSVIDPERGGPAAFLRFSEAAHRAGLGVLVDIVPNHMGIQTPELNRWWWDVLAKGRQSPFARAFDIDWAAGGGRVRVPVLADPAAGAGESELDRLRIDGDLLVYAGHRYPIAEGTREPGATPREVHDRQYYELIPWRRADDSLNYRRFFSVSSLAGIRVEDPWVFEESHREIARWFAEGLADGLRVDHPDGLADPGRYLDDLAEACENAPVWVEKILAAHETLPPTWQTAGTTGYDALADFDRVFVDARGRHALESIDSRLDPSGVRVEYEWAQLIHSAKRGIAEGVLRSEVQRLARLLPGVDAADEAITELLAGFPVYRSYLPLGVQHLEFARSAAVERRPDLAIAIDAIAVRLHTNSELSIRFQQTSGAVMAKGVEDTAFYRHSSLSSLNEVGGDPRQFSDTLAEFHARQTVRQATLPDAMTTLSTHDTKRSEDARARIAVLAECAADWMSTLQRLHEQLDLGDGALEHLLWEAVVGVWPASRDRLQEYARKAAREAGTSTSWAHPNAQFEDRLQQAVDAAFDDARVGALVGAMVSRVTAAGRSNALSAKLVQLCAPGIPDVYQGSELWEQFLVDPDNRRPVDFGPRRRLLRAIDGGWLPPVDETGAAKLLLTSRALRLRRDHPWRFDRYVPMWSHGVAADHLIAFDRGGVIALATRLPLGLESAGGWGDTAVELADRPVIDALTGRSFRGGAVRIVDLFDRYPVALLTE